jgi:hypothetical protein
MAGIEQAFHGINEFLIKGQCIEGLTADLTIFLKEIVLALIEGLNRLAERYIEAHKGGPYV